MITCKVSENKRVKEETNHEEADCKMLDKHALEKHPCGQRDRSNDHGQEERQQSLYPERLIYFVS